MGASKRGRQVPSRSVANTGRADPVARWNSRASAVEGLCKGSCLVVAVPQAGVLRGACGLTRQPAGAAPAAASSPPAACRACGSRTPAHARWSEQAQRDPQRSRGRAWQRLRPHHFAHTRCVR
eukprot:6201438-Pleurochrysis_carterae.AAC.1